MNKGRGLFFNDFMNESMVLRVILGNRFEILRLSLSDYCLGC